MSISRREAIKRTAISVSGLVFVPSALIIKGCSPGSLGSVGGEELEGLDPRNPGNNDDYGDGYPGGGDHDDHEDNDDNRDADEYDQDHDDQNDNGSDDQEDDHLNDDDHSDNEEDEHDDHGEGDNEENEQDQDIDEDDHEEENDHQEEEEEEEEEEYVPASFENISELRGKAGKEGQYAQLQGYHRAGDGGGSEVYWDSNATDLDDGGMVFKVNNVSRGRWKRQDTGYINVKWFGAKGDGVHHRGRDNDLHAFDRCFEYIKNHQVKKIYVPRGQYILEHRFNTLLNSDHNGLEFYGDGSASELKFANNVDLNGPVHSALWMMRWENNQSTGVPLKDIYIHDLQFNGNRQGHRLGHSTASGYGIWIGGSRLAKGSESSNIRIERVRTLNHTTSGFSLRTSNMVVRDCYSEGHEVHGFETRDDPKNILIDGYTAYRCGDGRGYGFDFSSGDELKINNFNVDRCHHGMKVSIGIKGVTMTNGRITNCVERAMDQSGSPHRDYTMVIDNVHLENNNGPARFNEARELTITNFTSINSGGNEAIFINNGIRQFNGENISISRASGRAMRLFAENANLRNITIDDADYGVQGSSSGNRVSMGGGVLRNVRNPILDVRGSTSRWTLDNIEFHGDVAINVDTGSVVEVNACDFTNVLNSYNGSGTVIFN